MSAWVKCSERMPEAQKPVLVRYMAHGGKMRTTMGWYAPAQTIEANEFEDEVVSEYDEVNDTYWLAEGWRDESQESEYHYGIGGVTHWQPLPAPPE